MLKLAIEYSDCILHNIPGLCKHDGSILKHTSVCYKLVPVASRSELVLACNGSQTLPIPMFSQDCAVQYSTPLCTMHALWHLICDFED